MFRLEGTIQSQNDAAIASDRQSIEQQLANCEQLKAQWNSSPRVRTPQNAQIVNTTCQTAEANARQLEGRVSEYSRGQRISMLTRTHPLNQDRIAALVATADYLNGRRSLDSLSGIGQGYKVFVAMNLNKAEASARTAQLSPAQKKLAACSAEATAKGLTGAERPEYIRACLSR
jgi:hypothetical protein